MCFRFRFALTLTAVLAGGTALVAPTAAEAAGPMESLPLVLNVAVPTESWERIEGDVGSYFQMLGRSVDRSVRERRLRINLTIGTDYQILDWLRQGLVDLAVVPELSAYLLARDGVELLDVGSTGFDAERLFPPQGPALLLHRGDDSQIWQERPADDEALERFARWLLCGVEDDPPAAAGCGEAAAAGAYRLRSASHLSSGSFLEPLTLISRWLDSLAPEAPARERFWNAFFEHVEFLFDEMPAAASSPGTTSRPGSRLVIAEGAAHSIFGRHAFLPLEVDLDPGVGAMIEREPPLPPFRDLALIEPYFGVRIFSFTVDESLRLLREHQAINDEQSLALILPGGGVKAAYQSKLVDELYAADSTSGQPRLKNFLTPVEPGDGPGPLDVRYVIGTSGGALLGFFVASLGTNGPWNLSQILWEKEGGRIITSTDVFGWTDLPRYLSLVFIFLIFCLWLGLFSFSSKLPLFQAREPRTAWRINVGLLVLPILLLGPVLIRQINGEFYQEHVPEIEGFLYLVFIWIVMFADHCIVRQKEARKRKGPRKAPLSVVLLAGVAMLAVPLAARGGWRADWLRDEVVFWVAIAVLVPLVTVGGLIVPLRSFAKKEELKRLSWSVHALEAVAAGVVSLVLLLGLEKLKITELAPFLLVALFLILCLAAAHSWIRSKRIDLFGDSRWLWRYRLLLVVLALLAMMLARPLEHEPGVASYLLAPSGLTIPAGSFLACFGILFALLAVVGLAFAIVDHLHVTHVIDFLAALALSLGHALLVNVILVIGILLSPDWVSPLELTSEFWKLLFWLALGTGLLLALAGFFKPRLAWLQRGLDFLCSHHPNGLLLSRRFLRMAALYIFALVWWNLVLAPALYGNRKAIEYLTGTLGHYRDAYCELHDCPPRAGEDDGSWYSPTAHFISPANVLRAREGTRYFFISPGEEPCPSIEERTGTGALWHRYRARFAGPSNGGDDGPAEGNCKDLEAGVADSWAFLKKVIFASGSPFPIFPAHRIGRPRAPAELENGGAGESAIDTLLLVDGGYSNNIPVEAAVTVGAEPVLIINSSHPLGHQAEAGEASVLAELFGPLARNLPRLPAYLFERSQQVDRISRQGMFVVSLAPSRNEQDWPPLFDFRPEVVRRMRAVAERDLERRIGFVESWGNPRFQVSFLIDPAAGG